MSPFSSFMLAGSKPSLSEGTHTIFLAAQSAWASPLLRKSFSRNRNLLSSVSAMLAAGSRWQEEEEELEAGWSLVCAGLRGAEGTSGSTSGPTSGLTSGLTSDLGLISALLNKQEDGDENVQPEDLPGDLSTTGQSPVTLTSPFFSLSHPFTPTPSLPLSPLTLLPSHSLTSSLSLLHLFTLSPSHRGSSFNDVQHLVLSFLSLINKV